MHACYLHGFASSPQSSKAQFFAERLAARGIALRCPDLNAPDFGTLTVSRMVAQTEVVLATLPPGPVVLMGSSLGGFVAWHVAARVQAGLAPPAAAHLARLVLLAPAFDFGAGDLGGIGAEGVARWKESGWHTFFHHAYDEPRRVHYALYEDARRYRSDLAVVSCPTLVFQGERDESVDPQMVAEFAARRPTILLRLLDDGHQLLDHMETLWSETSSFLGIDGE
jgi:pimeloyl-ACP methyl ester carboxylesterase